MKLTIVLTKTGKHDYHYNAQKSVPEGRAHFNWHLSLDGVIQRHQLEESDLPEKLLLTVESLGQS